MDDLPQEKTALAHALGDGHRERRPPWPGKKSPVRYSSQTKIPDPKTPGRVDFEARDCPPAAHRARCEEPNASSSFPPRAPDVEMVGLTPAGHAEERGHPPASSGA
jgi:hypothetical protein